MRFLKSSVAALAVVAAIGAASLVRADGDEKKGEKRDRPFLGINLAPAGKTAAKGVVIGEVLKDTGAEKAGLKKGDVILKLGDKEVASAKKFMELLLKLSPGDEVALLIERDGAQKVVKATLGKRPAGDDDDDDDDDDDHDGGHEEGHGEKR